jgi:NDP-sugar pyrophosphorylase family protein
MSRKWLEKVAKLLCVIPATFDAVQHNIREYTRSTYARRHFPGVKFGPLAYATSDCKFEAPCQMGARCILSKTEMGRHSYCGGGSFVAHSTIGRFCSIGNEVIIGAWLHPTQIVSTFPGFYSSNKHTINLRRDDEIKEVADVIIEMMSG